MHVRPSFCAEIAQSPASFDFANPALCIVKDKKRCFRWYSYGFIPGLKMEPESKVFGAQA